MNYCVVSHSVRSVEIEIQSVSQRLHYSASHVDNLFLFLGLFFCGVILSRTSFFKTSLPQEAVVFESNCPSNGFVSVEVVLEPGF